jgi:hypothetical protein
MKDSWEKGEIMSQRVGKDEFEKADMENKSELWHFGLE